MISVLPGYRTLLITVAGVNTSIPVLQNFSSVGFEDLDFSWHPTPAKSTLENLLRNYFEENETVDCSLNEPPQPTSVPNWQGFLDDCDLPETGGNGVFNELLKINFSLAMDAYFLTLRFKSGLAGEEELRTLGFIYSQFIPSLSPTVTDSLRAAIEANNIPLAIVQIQN
jgi:hypothetical protein